MKGNPYQNMFGYPYMGMYGQPSPMKTPEQYQQELMAQLQPQLSQYKQMYESSQQQAKAASNAGTYFKVGSYDEMMAVQVPADGKPIMVLDENAGRLYSKRFENGQTYVVGFQLTPLDSKEPQGKAEETSSIEKALEAINARLEVLEGKGDEPPANPPQ